MSGPLNALKNPATQSPDLTIDFENDDHVHFDTVTQKWIYENDDGTEMQWDTQNNIWIPVIDDDLVRQQQAVYSIAGVDEEAPAAPEAARINKKRKANDYTSNSANVGPPKKRGKKTGNESTTTEAKPPSKNTAVYVSNLPLDTTQDEIFQRFSKCGVIMEDDGGDPKIKMYADENGHFMGDALVVFFMEASVTLCINILDDAELRIGDPTTVMKVRRGEFGHKGQEGQGEAPRRVVDKKKATQRIKKMKNKISDWDFEDGFGPTEEPDETEKVVTSRVVVLKHMFTLDELKEDPSLLLDLKEDVREEAETIGDVTNVVLYDEEPEGVMTIKFRDPISASACILKMNGRWFSGRKIEATFFTGKQRFRRSGTTVEIGEDGGEKKRLEDFENWLMKEGEVD